MVNSAFTIVSDLNFTNLKNKYKWKYYRSRYIDGSYYTNKNCLEYQYNKKIKIFLLKNGSGRIEGCESLDQNQFIYEYILKMI